MLTVVMAMAALRTRARPWPSVCSSRREGKGTSHHGEARGNLQSTIRTVHATICSLPPAVCDAAPFTQPRSAPALGCHSRQLVPRSRHKHSLRPRRHRRSRPGPGRSRAPVFTRCVLLTGLRMRVPAIVLARMVLNAPIDMADRVGAARRRCGGHRVEGGSEKRRAARTPRAPGRAAQPWRLRVRAAACIATVSSPAPYPILLLIWLLTQFSLM